MASGGSAGLPLRDRACPRRPNRSPHQDDDSDLAGGGHRGVTALLARYRAARDELDRAADAEIAHRVAIAAARRTERRR